MQWVRRLSPLGHKIRQAINSSSRRAERGEMGAVEKIALNFLKNELTKNPQVAGNLILHLLQQAKLDPTLIQDTVAFIEEILPILLSSIKV